MAYRNTAYWPERYTPIQLAAQAAHWREIAEKHLNASAHLACAEDVAKNASRAQRTATETPTNANLNTAAGVANVAADLCEQVAEELAALTEPCPEPPSFAIVYREPVIEGVPDHWVAEVFTIAGWQRIPSLRTYSTTKPELCLTRERAVAELRSLARRPDLNRQAAATDYHGARLRSAIQCALETEPTEVRIRLAGEERPAGWEKSR